MPSPRKKSPPGLMDHKRFVRSLNAEQRQFFLQQQSEAEARYQEAFRLASSLLGMLSSLQSEATQHRLTLPSPYQAKQSR